MKNLEATYLFKSERLGFRNWEMTDLDDLVKLNSDSRVMKYFPKKASKIQCSAFIVRMQEMYDSKGYCYFVIENLKTRKFVGFIGISDVDFASDFTPCIDIGWRLLPEYWGLGLASEGALKCINYASEVLNISEIYAIAPSINIPSIKVMKKIGMQKVKTFIHPLLLEFENLKQCELYISTCSK